MYFDIVIIGGGIAGIYTLYKLSKKYKESTFLLLEKDGRLGGRISTYNHNKIIFEEGAGRFNDLHILLIQLIDELHLKHKVRKTSGQASYIPDPTIPHNYPKNSWYNGLLGMVLGEADSDSAKLILQVILASMFSSKETLLQQNFLQYARKILTKEQVQFIEYSFGYSKELHDMSAYHCIQLLKQLNPINHNYVMNGGLSQIIDKMVENIQKNPHNSIMLEKDVRQIHYKNNIFKVVIDASETFTCRKVICALPQEALKQFHIFKPIQNKWLDKITSGSLCRIYSRFPKNKNGKYWFENLPKITTNNDLRMVIPYDYENGVVMISYTDSHFADQWNHLYCFKGKKAVEQKLRELIRNIQGIDIPKPIETTIVYWKHGVGYWKIGVDSSEISDKMIKPFESMDLFICGENYSDTFQQWIEGSLETSERVILRTIESMNEM